MTIVTADVSDEKLLSIARDWLDVLAAEDYASVFEHLGYGIRFDREGVEAIRDDIKRYRSEQFFPGVTDFVVSDWRLAQGGNPEPFLLLRRYAANDLRIRRTIEMDLPLNGKWSDLEIDFVVFERPDGLLAFTLEDINCTRQSSEEFERTEAAAD